MSEFKFACPVCGQHITADSANSGSQLECPTCYRKIVVPQAPTSSDPKFILSAAEANKPRPPQMTPGASPITKPARTSRITVVLLILALLLAVGALVFFRGKIFGLGKPSEPQLAGSVSGEATEGDGNSSKKIANVPAATNNISWNLDLSQVPFPEAPAEGKLWGEFVSPNRNALTGGALSFRQSTRGLPDLSVTIYFFAKQPEELRGKTINISTNDTPAPRVAIRWKEGKEIRSEFFTNGYALNLELGDIVGNRIAGKVYLSLPDDEQSRVAGSFVADIKKPTTHAPKHN